MLPGAPPVRLSVEYQDIPLELFRKLPEETWSERFFRAAEYANGYIDAAAAGVLRDLGVWPSGPTRFRQIAERAKIIEERRGELRWLVKKCILAGTLAVDGKGVLSPGATPPSPTKALREALLAEIPSLSTSCDLVDLAAGGYPPFLRGNRDGSAILFNAGTLAVWERYFSRENPVYSASNLLGAHVVAEQLGPEPVHILEVGGGMGSAAEALLERLSSGSEKRVASYLFTELAPSFLRRAEERLKASFPTAPVEVRRLDLNLSLERQGVVPESVDVVYAVNVLHATRDLLLSLRALKDALSPGGLLVLVEAVRGGPGRLLHYEFCFQLLREFREVRLHPDFRPHGGFLEWPHWKKALETAGFDAVHSVPDFPRAVEAYSIYAMAALVGRKPLASVDTSSAAPEASP